MANAINNSISDNTNHDNQITADILIQNLLYPL